MRDIAAKLVMFEKVRGLLRQFAAMEKGTT
jgi:hypothetical protein